MWRACVDRRYDGDVVLCQGESGSVRLWTRVMDGRLVPFVCPAVLVEV